MWSEMCAWSVVTTARQLAKKKASWENNEIGNEIRTWPTGGYTGKLFTFLWENFWPYYHYYLLTDRCME